MLAANISSNIINIATSSGVYSVVASIYENIRRTVNGYALRGLFAQTVNKLKGKVTILFITHQLPKGLQVDETVVLDKQQVNKVGT